MKLMNDEIHSLQMKIYHILQQFQDLYHSSWEILQHLAGLAFCLLPPAKTPEGDKNKMVSEVGAKTWLVVCCHNLKHY